MSRSYEIAVLETTNPEMPHVLGGPPTEEEIKEFIRIRQQRKEAGLPSGPDTGPEYIFDVTEGRFWTDMAAYIEGDKRKSKKIDLSDVLSST